MYDVTTRELGGNSALQTIKNVQLTNAIEYVCVTHNMPKSL